MMKKKVILLGASAWLIGAVIIASGVVRDGVSFGEGDGCRKVYAEKSIQSEIDDANKKKQSIEEEKKQLQADIATIESKKKNVVDYIQGLDGKLTDLADKIEKNKESCEQTRSQIQVLRKEEKQAQKEKKKQYDTMSKRIKYIYENGNDGYLELLLESQSLSELFNRAEYVSKVTSYDRQMLKNYQSVCEKLQQSQQQKERQLEQLKGLKKSLKLEQESVNVLMDKKNEELNQYKILVQDKSSQISSKDNLLQQQEDELEQLMEAQRQQEEAARKKEEQEKKKQQAEKNRNTTSNQSSNNNSTTQNSQSTQNNTTVSHSGYGWPLSTSGRISSYFGYRTAPTAGASTFHKGIDISVPVGTSILATKKGTVITASYSSSAGNYITISHGDGVYSYYMHCSKLSVKAGAKVSKGQKIALSGNTGISTGPHLHFAIYANGGYVNPLKYVSR